MSYPERNKRETSKKFLYFSYAVVLILLSITVISSFIGIENSSIVTVTVAWIGECAAYTGFYIWKSKNENRAKYAQAFIQDLAETYGIDSVARILDTILKD